MRALTRRSAAAVAGVLVLTGAAACGSNSKKSSTTGSTSSTSGGTKGSSTSDPQKTFTDALAKLSKTAPGSVTLKVAATAAQLDAFSKAANGTSTIPPAAATALAGATIVLSKSGKDSSVDVTIGGKPDIQFVKVGANVYLRVDVPTIVQLVAPDKAADLGQLTKGFGSQYPFLTDLVAGKFIEIDAASLASVESLAKGELSKVGAAPSGAAPSVDVTSLESTIATALQADLTAKDVGPAAQGEHLTLTGNLKKVAADLETAAQDIPGVSTVSGKFDTTSIPDKDVTFDAYVNGGSLTALAVNIAQFNPKTDPTATPLVLELDFGTSTPTISAPSGATKADLSGLLSTVAPLLGGKG
jgi:hypothetical protein